MKPRQRGGKQSADELTLRCAHEISIIRELGQDDILLPALVSEALAANDRIKVRMSALQAARHAQ
jgi:hypothetical protein